MATRTFDESLPLFRSYQFINLMQIRGNVPIGRLRLFVQQNKKKIVWMPLVKPTVVRSRSIYLSISGSSKFFAIVTAAVVAKEYLTYGWSQHSVFLFIDLLAVGGCAHPPYAIICESQHSRKGPLDQCVLHGCRLLHACVCGGCRVLVRLATRRRHPTELLYANYSILCAITLHCACVLL